MRVLHVELERELRLGRAAPAAYTSDFDAEEQHRRLSSELQRWRGELQPRSRLPRERLLLWSSWGVVVAVVSGLLLRYGVALFNRALWQHEHPDGVWISRYYADIAFGDLLLTRYDVTVDHDWGGGPPAEAMPRDDWSATWDTCISNAVEVKLDLRLIADEHAKFIVDDSLKLQVSWRKPASGQVVLTPGTHHLRIEYQDWRKLARLQLQGLDFSSNSSYQFKRPVPDAGVLRCESSASP